MAVAGRAHRIHHRVGRARDKEKKMMMQKQRRRSHLVWSLFAFAVILGIAAVARVPSGPTATTTNRDATPFTDPQIYQRHEPVGWVFGRIVGFQGADKPFLPRHSMPAPNSSQFRSSFSP